MSPVTSNKVYTCAACLGPIGAGQPFVNCAASGDRYHIYCYATLDEHPAVRTPAAKPVRKAGSKREARVRPAPARA